MLSHADNPVFWTAFNECVEMLDEVHAEVFILRDLEDVSVEEVCGIFGLSAACSGTGLSRENDNDRMCG